MCVCVLVCVAWILRIFLVLFQVLDEEAEVFILKLWRLLIYETEAKHLGIAKSY